MKNKKIAGIICEYNPFHNGHAYQINEIKKRGYDTVVCVMSGNTVQRGEFAIVDKYARAECAIKCGADLVVELPYPYSSSGAEYFASAGVNLISAAGADAICFGSECGNFEILKRAAEICSTREFEDEYKKSATSQGTAEAYYSAYKKISGDEYPSGANDILGVAYIKSILTENIDLKVEIIKRKGSDYRETELSPNITVDFPSASMLRKSIITNGINDSLVKYIPENAYSVIKNAEITYNIERLDRSVITFFRLCGLERIELNDIFEASGGLAEKLCKESHNVDSLDELVEKAAGKKYPHSRVRRAILHCIAGTLNEDIKHPPVYSTVLGFNDNGRALLAYLRKKSRIPFAVKPADATKYVADAERQSVLSHRIDSLYTLLYENMKESYKYIASSPIVVKSSDISY